jgi:hypothetical protein
MTFDPDKILQSKREFRQRLAARPIEEKLAMLDALRERALAIRPMPPTPKPEALHEESPSYLGRNQNEGERYCSPRRQTSHQFYIPKLYVLIIHGSESSSIAEMFALKPEFALENHLVRHLLSCHAGIIKSMKTEPVSSAVHS